MATGFAIAVTLVDLGLGFPRNLNVPPPQSLLFYPIMGLVAETFFHLIPLAILPLVIGRLLKTLALDRLIWGCIVIASFLEPVFQLLLGSTGNSLLDGYVFVHVLAFGLAQMYVFRRFDFVSMYAFRLVYYLYWHIIWGYFRLQWLF